MCQQTEMFKNWSQPLSNSSLGTIEIVCTEIFFGLQNGRMDEVQIVLAAVSQNALALQYASKAA